MHCVSFKLFICFTKATGTLMWRRAQKGPCWSLNSLPLLFAPGSLKLCSSSPYSSVCFQPPTKGAACLHSPCFVPWQCPCCANSSVAPRTAPIPACSCGICLPSQHHSAFPAGSSQTKHHSLGKPGCSSCRELCVCGVREETNPAKCTHCM